MCSLNHAILSNAVRIALCLLVLILPNHARGDDLTGLSQDDPKDLLPLSPPASQPTGEVAFLPLPRWSRLVTMPPLPEQLKPLGKKTTVAASPAPESLAPPKETPPPARVSAETSREKTSPAPAESSPALIAVSPFLQWIKANPQAAAAEARQQANGYHAPATSDSGSPNGAGSAGGTGPDAASAPEAPYWLPPLLDSADTSPTPVGGSAAIYQTPQR